MVKMRRSTIISLFCGLIASTVAVAAPVSPFMTVKKVHDLRGEKSPAREGKKIMKAPVNTANMKHTGAITYGWNGRKWILEDKYNYEYDTKGNVVVEKCEDAEGDFVKTTYEYNENGKVIRKESVVSNDGVNYSNNKRTEFEYDPILTNIITKRTEWLWMNEDWRLVGNNYKRIINRDEDGNIVNVVIAVLFGDIYDPTQRLEITYGPDGTADTITEMILTYDGKNYAWEQGMRVSDITWDRTDGQIIDAENLFMGANRIKSAFWEDADDMEAQAMATYAEDSDDYSVDMVGVMEDDMDFSATVNFTFLENNGFIAESTMLMSYRGMSMEQTGLEEERYDAWGLLLLSRDETYFDGEPEEISRTEGDVEYNDEGLPVCFTIKEGYSEGEDIEMEPVFRCEYSDYIDVTTSVGEMGAESDAQVKYFNLQGMQINNPAPGSIVIKKRGGSVEKQIYYTR